MNATDIRTLRIESQATVPDLAIAVLHLEGGWRYTNIVTGSIGQFSFAELHTAVSGWLWSTIIFVKLLLLMPYNARDTHHTDRNDRYIQKEITMGDKYSKLTELR